MKIVVLLAFSCSVLLAQGSLPYNFGSGSNVVSLASDGSIGSTGAVAAGTGYAASGLIQFFGTGGSGSGGSLVIQAPTAFLNGSTVLNQTWNLPSGSLPSAYSTIMVGPMASSTSTLSYGTVTGATGQINVSASATGYSLSLNPSLNLGLGGGSFALNDSSGNEILGLAPSGSSGSYVQIANDSSIPPIGPLVTAAGTGSSPIPLRISDANAGGVELFSNGGQAMKVTNGTNSGSYLALNASPSAMIAGKQAVSLVASSATPSNPTPTNDLSLSLTPQNNGSIVALGNVDLANNALAVEVGTETSVVAGSAVVIDSAGKAAIAGIGSTHGVFGVALTSYVAGVTVALVAIGGKVACTFDSLPTPTASHYVIASTSTAGNCRDGGTTVPTVQPLGILLNASAGVVLLRPGY